MGAMPDTRRRRTPLYRQFRCSLCPEHWRPWKEGGEATAEKHAQDVHGAPFQGEFQDVLRTAWATGDGRRLD